MSILQARDLFSGYGDITVIKAISFQVEEGEMVSLVGANGAGKTTLLRTLTGLIRASDGEVLLEGKRIDRLMPHQISEAGFIMVPEGKQLFQQMSVEENLEVGSFNRRVGARRRESLKQVYDLFPRLADRRHQLAGSLSGGEQQMVAVGRALMGQPRILALDEPSLGMAPMLVEQVFNVIDSIRRDGLTILLIEQNVQQALELSDRGYVIENGSITMVGTGRELLSNDHLRKTYMGI